MDAVMPDVIERELRIAARPETVYDLWTDPARLVTWMGREASLDVRPGGAWRIRYNDSDVAAGEYVELDRPSRIVMTWGWEGEKDGGPTPPGASRVEVDLEPDGDGTLLRLRHSGLVPAVVPTHIEGWDLFLPRLIEAAAA